MSTVIVLSQEGLLSYMFRPARLYLDIDYALTCTKLAQKFL